MSRHGRFFTYSLTCWKASSHSEVHSNLPSFFNALKNGIYLYLALERNRPSAASRPINAWTSFILRGD